MKNEKKFDKIDGSIGHFVHFVNSLSTKGV